MLAHSSSISPIFRSCGHRAGAGGAVAAYRLHALERAAHLLIQLTVFIVAGLLFTLTPLRFALVPHAALYARAHRATLEQFVVRRIGHTKNRTGILIFVSLAERYAHVVADEGIAQKVPNSEWPAAIDALVSHMRSARSRQDLPRRLSAVGRCSRPTPA